MGRTVRELEESLDAVEWNDWIVYLSLYDLPDAYFATAKLGCLIASAFGSKTDPDKLVSYYKVDRPEGSRGIPEFVAFATGYMKSRCRDDSQSFKRKPRYQR